MKLIIITPAKLLDILNFVGMPLIAIYFGCMFLYPFSAEQGDWWYAQKVWHSWQPLNASMLAFFSTIIAFNITRYNERKQRERNFEAAKAFLPQALSELATYFQSCAILLEEARIRVNSNSRKEPLQNPLPVLPTHYQKVFKQCIRFAEPEVAKHLAYILRQLQIHNSRLTDLYESFDEEKNKNKVRTLVIVPINIIDYLISLGELQALIHKTFDFSRDSAELDNSDLVLCDYQNAYFILKICDAVFSELITRTKELNGFK
ncbi:MAG: hypothetical protein U1D41_11755 [Nitrosomonas sp.]|uniref:hypothetical protein n=1 Tax=Nitrosomonas sp. TaxID=42353 RepID=UPI0027338B94|nr:hypothetical protein [Nitrosomonas sp.]MDP3281468.1 hypothetical protein [Nitrosomonas sp.]MDP3663135.1 hypothetical protein [Nitrosomonas sp.]MDZ4106813.1 hypothetical protein [Nitrosomonas sp.]